MLLLQYPRNSYDFSRLRKKEKEKKKIEKKSHQEISVQDLQSIFQIQDNFTIYVSLRCR